MPIKQALADRLRKALATVPRSRTLYKLARFYCNAYTGDNNSDMHTNGEARAMRRLLTASHTVFDVGANVGDWSKLALSIKSSLHIHCFEPASTTFEKLRVRGFPANQVTFNPIGLSDSASTATLHLHELSNVNSLHAGIGDELAAHTGDETITLDTLDAYCQRTNITSIDYLKIDVEGHELAVLRGATQMLTSRAIRHIQLEYGAGYLVAGGRLEHVFKLLREHEFKPHKITARGLEPVPNYHLGLENFQLSNWLFSLDDLH